MFSYEYYNILLNYMNVFHNNYIWSLGDKPERSLKSDKHKYTEYKDNSNINHINHINHINENTFTNDIMNMYTITQNELTPSYTFKKESSKRDKANEMINQRELIGQINMNPFIHNNSSYEKVIEEQETFLRSRNSNSDN